MRNSSPSRIPGHWKHLFICPSRSLFDALTPILAELTPQAPCIDLATYPSRRALNEVVLAQAPTLAFLDFSTDRDAALGVLTDLSAIKATLPVVALHTSNDPDLILRCLRQGAKEFLHLPFSTDAVSGALERLSRFLIAPASSGNDGKIFCIIPGKGACGASTIAAALSLAIARAEPKNSVLLADLDPITSTMSFQLKLKSQFSFVDALSNASALDESIWRAVVTNWQGIDVILSPEMPIDGVTEAGEVATLLAYARAKYNSIVVDSRGPYGNWGLTTARAADELLVITTNELPVLHATQRMLTYMTANGVEEHKMKLIVNRFNPDAGLGREAIEMALNHEVFDILPNDAESIQRALLESKPVPANAPFGRGVANICSRLVGRPQKTQRRTLVDGILGLFESKA